MSTIINISVIVVLVIIWGLYLKRFILKSSMNILGKASVIFVILVLNIASFYIINSSVKKSSLFEFNRLNLSLSLDQTSPFLSTERENGKKSEHNLYESKLEKEIFENAKKIFSKNRIKYNTKSKNELIISFKDNFHRKDGKKRYFIETTIQYGEDQKISTMTLIKDIDNIKYKQYLTIFNNSLNELIKAIHYKKKIEDKTPEELIEILSHKHNLPQPFYIQIFNKLLRGDKYPKLPAKIMNKFINNPATFSEASGYAVLSNDCDNIGKMIENSLTYRMEPLMLMMEILSQSKCEIAKGYMFVLSGSRYNKISSLAKKNFKEMINNPKEIIYKDGKRVKE